jgi:hypothetical protein
VANNFQFFSKFEIFQKNENMAKQNFTQTKKLVHSDSSVQTLLVLEMQVPDGTHDDLG